MSVLHVFCLFCVLSFVLFLRGKSAGAVSLFLSSCSLSCLYIARMLAQRVMLNGNDFEQDLGDSTSESVGTMRYLSSYYSVESSSLLRHRVLRD